MNPQGASGSAVWLPWTHSCFVCGQDNPHGLRLKSRVEGGRVVLDYTARASDLGYRHMIHGGIVMTLLDEVMTWAAILDARQACVAAEITVRLRKPVRVGQALRVEGEAAGGRPRLRLARGRILDANGEELAAGQGKYVPMPADLAGLCAKDFVKAEGTMDPRSLFGQ